MHTHLPGAPNKALHPTVLLPLRYGKTAGELARRTSASAKVDWRVRVACQKEFARAAARLPIRNNCRFQLHC